MGVHIIQVMDDHFSIESHGFGDPSCQETTTCIYGHPPTTPRHAVCTGIYNIKHVFCFMFNILGLLELLTYIYLSKH